MNIKALHLRALIKLKRKRWKTPRQPRGHVLEVMLWVSITDRVIHLFTINRRGARSVNHMLTSVIWTETGFKASFARKVSLTTITVQRGERGYQRTIGLLMLPGTDLSVKFT